MSSEGNKVHLFSACTDTINDTKHISVYLAITSLNSFVVYKNKQTKKPKKPQNKTTKTQTT